MDVDLSAQCCIAGGGPAGMMLGYLMARSGVETIVLEKHADFLRDFRGDTVHPSTMQVMDELGLLDEFLKIPHSEIRALSAIFGSTRVQVADFSHLPTRCKYIAFMPQWDFLNFLAEKGKRFPALTVMMNAEATDVLRDGDRITGVRASTRDGSRAIAAELTVAADGRRSALRERTSLPLRDIGSPIDVMWFRVARDDAPFDQDFGHVEPGSFMITIDRNDYWQCALVIPKGSAEKVRAAGLTAFREKVASIAPVLRAHIDGLQSWDDVKLLTVTIDFLTRWHAPGFLCIGDAAHAMSPVGGVGINLAIQDAVATANALAAKVRTGSVVEADLAAIQRRRTFPTRAIQTLQVAVQNRFLDPIVSGTNAEARPPLLLQVASRSRWVRGLAARAVAVGLRPEHVRSPAA